MRGQVHRLTHESVPPLPLLSYLVVRVLLRLLELLRRRASTGIERAHVRWCWTARCVLLYRLKLLLLPYTEFSKPTILICSSSCHLLVVNLDFEDHFRYHIVY